LIHASRTAVNWLFIGSLLLPAMYVAFSPGTYFAVWYQIISAATTWGFTSTILLIGAVEAILYLAKLILDRRGISQSRIVGNAIFVLHLVLGMSVLLIMFIEAPMQRDLAIGVFNAFLGTEFMIFPLLGILYLQDMVRHPRENLATVLLTSGAVYISVALLTSSTHVRLDSSFGSIPNMSPLEAVGARALFLVVLMARLVPTPFFWQSTSLYSLEIAPPPAWVSGIYVLAIAFYLYYDSHRKIPAHSDSGTSDWSSLITFDLGRVSVTIFVAVVLAFVAVTISNFILPQNFSGYVIQLFIISAALFASFIMIPHGAHRQ